MLKPLFVGRIDEDEENIGKRRLLKRAAECLDQVVRQITVTENTQTPTARQTLDISGLSGAYRIGLRLQTTTGNILNAYLAYMALE